MIFITSQFETINITRDKYNRDTLFYEIVHLALFNSPLNIPNFTTNIYNTLDNI